MDYSVMTTPALVIDDRVLLAGRVPSPSALRQLLADASDRHSRTPNTIEGNHP